MENAMDAIQLANVTFKVKNAVRNYIRKIGATEDEIAESIVARMIKFVDPDTDVTFLDDTVAMNAFLKSVSPELRPSFAMNPNIIEISLNWTRNKIKEFLNGIAKNELNGEVTGDELFFILASHY